ncbi:hypothetical protein D3C77_156540 [compost metagenome]
MSILLNVVKLHETIPKVGARFPRYAPCALLSAAVNEAERNVQAPRALIFSGALTAISLACQGLIDVCKPTGQCVPTSLMLLSIAGSGERKSTAENVFLGPIREFQCLEYKKYQEYSMEWSAQIEVWKEKKKVILKKISKNTDKGIDSSEETELLIAHERSKPLRPRQYKMVYDDATSEALFYGLHNNLPSAGLISSEGAGVLNGGALNDLPKQNSLWSGDSITVDRVSVESYTVSSSRLTVSVMLQESAFKEYMERRGERSRGSGLWARFLVCHPKSTQGTRLIDDDPLSWERCNEFSARIGELLVLNRALLDSPEKERLTMHFSQEAKERWRDVFNEIESGIVVGGRFEHISDHASKLADNIARVAALLHFFDGGQGDISCGVLDFAVDLCCWYSDQFVQIFVPPSQEDIDANNLLDWLYGYFGKGHGEIRKNKILQCGPNKLRNKLRLERALDILQERKFIDVVRYKGVAYVDLI